MCSDSARLRQWSAWRHSRGSVARIACACVVSLLCASSLLAAPAEPPVYVGHPTNEIGHILALARHAGYDELADLIAAEDYGRASAALAKMEKGLFPWRMSVTNGYQHGFLLYALKGYILEKSNDPPKAYRQYQNSRGCLDDDAAMMYYPQPRLEVLIGIGRTCNAVGRYTDSKDYLDVARIEGSEYADISAQADRALIRRGVEIGDYLVWRYSNGFTMSDLLQNLLSFLDPNEGLRVVIVQLDVFFNSGDQFRHTAEHATLQTLAGDFCKPSFNQIQP